MGARVRIGVVCALLSAALVGPAAAVAGDDAEVHELRRRLESQEALIERLLEKVEDLERRLDAGAAAPAPPPRRGVPIEAEPPPSRPAVPERVELDADELPAVPASESSEHVLARPWYRNITLSGFAAGGYAWTGNDAARGHGGFLNYQAQLEVDAEVWEHVRVYHELETTKVGFEDSLNVRVGELYVHLRDVGDTLFDRPSSVGVKVGRMDVPFGEDYLTRDVIDNPLVTWSAAIPYAFDEGFLVHGETAGVGWIASVMDGTFARAFEDDSEKFLSLKLFGNPTEALYLSASSFWNGEAAESAIGLGGSYFMPVGAAGFPSAAGMSSSTEVDSYAYELDARYDFGDLRHVKLQFGQVFVDDRDSTFDRTIYYGQLEPVWNLDSIFERRVYVAGRLSAVGTFDDDEGYIFEGRPFAEGHDDFGYDTRSLWRAAAGIGYRPNDRLLLKIEYSRDDFRVIDASPLRDSNERRDLVAGLIAAEF